MTISQGQGILGNDTISLSSLQLIGISGHAGVGKDTVAEYLAEKYENVYGEAFAEPLKRACAAAFGLPLEHFHDREWKEQESIWGPSPRKIAQFVGTEMFRTVVANLYGQWTYSHWIRMMEMRLTGLSAPPEGQGFYSPGDTVIITDVRFEDEADWIQQNGGTLLEIRRPGFEGKVGIEGHASEKKFYPLEPSRAWLIQNTTILEDLYSDVDEFITHFSDQGILKLKYKETNGYSESSF